MPTEIVIPQIIVDIIAEAMWADLPGILHPLMLNPSHKWPDKADHDFDCMFGRALAKCGPEIDGKKVRILVTVIDP